MRIKWTLEWFESRVGRLPENDELLRVNCDRAGEPEHWQCGICVHDLPVFHCLECQTKTTEPGFVRLGDWIDYQPRRERDKECYDIMLRDGSIVECCWPNGIHFTRMHGFVPAKAGPGPYADYRVIKIRRCVHPMDLTESGKFSEPESIKAHV